MKPIHFICLYLILVALCLTGCKAGWMQDQYSRCRARLGTGVYIGHTNTFECYKQDGTLFYIEKYEVEKK